MLDVPAYQAALTAARMVPAVHLVVGQNGQATLVTPDNPEQYFSENPSGNLPVDPNEKGPKDTVRANPMEATHIRAHFDIAGKYVALPHPRARGQRHDASLRCRLAAAGDHGEGAEILPAPSLRPLFMKCLEGKFSEVWLRKTYVGVPSIGPGP